MRAAAFALVFALGCGAASPIDRARETLATATVAAAESDKVVASHYRIAVMRANANAATHSEWLDIMAGMDRAVAAVVGLRSALLAAEASLDAWEAGEDGGRWMAVAGCVGVAASRLAESLQGAGVAVPASLARLVSLASVFGSCGGE